MEDFMMQKDHMSFLGKYLKNYYIYMTINLVEDKIYIGQRGSICIPEEDNTYLGSGRKFQEVLKEFGRKNFSKTILEKCSFEDLRDREKFWVAFYESNNPKIGYNLTSGGSNGSTYTKEVCERLSESTTNYFKNPKNREKQSKNTTNYFSIIENRENQSKIQLSQPIFICTYCSRRVRGQGSFNKHQKYCDKNPNRETVTMKRENCCHCNKLIAVTNLKYHESICTKNPNPVYPPTTVCPRCTKEVKNIHLKRHERSCLENEIRT
jgi:hypothetical protein